MFKMLSGKMIDLKQCGHMRLSE